MIVTHNQTSSLRDKTFKGSQDEFETILSYILLGAEKDALTAGIEAVAKIQNDLMTVTVQRHVEGIAVSRHLHVKTITAELISHQQRFANIKLPETPDEEVELYDWCGLTVQSRNKATTEVNELKKKLQKKESEAQRLEAELQELVKVKNANEDSLIEKFSLLLNEKKLKIRDQQRILETATVDPVKLEAVLQSRENAKSRSPGPSRSGKRKAKAVKDESEEESDGGFEKMDVDEQQPPNDSDEDQRRTPDTESTADEASDDEEPPHPPPPAKKTVHELRDRNITTKASSSTAQASVDAHPPPPPKRELPFGKKKAAPPPKEIAAAQGSETESDDDDEL